VAGSPFLESSGGFPASPNQPRPSGPRPRPRSTQGVAESDIQIQISDLKIRYQKEVNIRYLLVPTNAKIRLA
jgi:hypothetical protein